MNLRLAALGLYFPESLKQEGLQELFRLTADAFRTPMPDIDGLSHQEKLQQFALFTLGQAAQVKSEDEDPVKGRLLINSRQMGAKLRETMHVKTVGDSLNAARLLYRALGIDFRADEKGEVEIRQCYFSKFYTGRICRLISSLDEGLISGLTGGGLLSFSARISEGHRCCLARINFGDDR